MLCAICRWFKQHETLDRLNIQAHKNAMNSSDEYVMESFVTFDKMKTLIYDLLMTEVWKEELYPLLKKELNEVNSIRSYMAVSKSTLSLSLNIKKFKTRGAWKDPEFFIFRICPFVVLKTVLDQIGKQH